MKSKIIKGSFSSPLGQEILRDLNTDDTDYLKEMLDHETKFTELTNKQDIERLNKDLEEFRGSRFDKFKETPYTYKQSFSKEPTFKEQFGYEVNIVCDGVYEVSVEFFKKHTL